MNISRKDLSLPKLIKKLRKPGMVATLVRGSGIVFMTQGFGAVLGYLTQICLARWMGASEYGFYTYIMAWGILGSMFSALGFAPGLLRFVPEYRTKQDDARLKGVLQSSLAIAIVTSVAIALIGTGVMLWIASQRTVENLVAIILGFWTLPFLVVNTLSVNMLRGVRKMAQAYIPTQVLRPIIILAGAFGFYVAQGYEPVSSSAVLLCTIAALLVVELIATWYIHQYLPISHKSVRPIYEVRSWLRISLPLLLIGSFIKILKKTDLLMIGMFMLPQYVAFYNAAVKTANLASFALSSVNGIAAPMIASTFAEGDRAQLQKLMTRIMQMVVVPSLLMSLVVIGLSRPILWTFGPEFVQAQWALIILTFAQFVRATTGPAGYLLELTGYQDQSARIRAVSASLNIVLNIVGIKFFGIIGAAGATAIAIIVERIWVDYLAKKHINVNASLFSHLVSNSNKDQANNDEE